LGCRPIFLLRRLYQRSTACFICSPSGKSKEGIFFAKQVFLAKAAFGQSLAEIKYSFTENAQVKGGYDT
jgi:hypothetical protein